MNRCEREAWTYTKWITALNTALWVAVVLYSIVFWTATREFPEDILQAVSLPYMAVMGFYFGKSLLENKWKHSTKDRKSVV
jgi:hypothetical protein